MSAELNELAERVEALSGPDRETDGRIWCAITGHRFVRFIRWEERVTWGEIEGSDRQNTCCSGMVFEHSSGGDRRNARFQQFTTSPDYTASIDTAMRLVPADCNVELHRADGSGVAWCDRPDADYKPVTHAATLPLALTAAALRARSNAASQ